MVVINIVGLNGDSFNIDINESIYNFTDLKMKICGHLKNTIQEQIYKDLNLDVNLGLGEVEDEVFYKIEQSPLFKNWLNVNKTKYIILMKNNIILDNDNFKNIELQENDIINYVIKQRF